jgi:hypothetical protein
MMTAEERLRALSERKADSERFRAAYALCKESLVEQGWSESDLADLYAVLAADLAEGPGVERPFVLTLDERRSAWRAWFAFHVLAGRSSGVQERIRAAIAAARGSELLAT